MNLRKIFFFTEEIDFNLKNKTLIRRWICETLKAEGFDKLGELNFIFCSDEYLLSINQEYLNHDTYTDIITFDNSEDKKSISGDIFISMDRIQENAVNFKVSVSEELHRVMIHGILHLCGYTDEKKADKDLMTVKENFYLKKIPL